jgi:hypothetical protein
MQIALTEYLVTDSLTPGAAPGFVEKLPGARRRRIQIIHFALHGLPK